MNIFKVDKNEEILKNRVIQILKKWKVIDLLKNEYSNEKIDTIILNIFSELHYLTSKKHDYEIFAMNLSESINDILDENNIEVDNVSCDNMAEILTKIVDEYLAGSDAYYNQIIR